jgi:uncharacterized membrane protein YqjE
MNQQVNNGRSVTAVLADMKEELKQFVETRIKMLNTELRDKLKTLKIAAPLAAAAVLLLLTAYLLFTISLVGLLFAFLPDNPYRWCLAFLSVAVLWSILGGIAGYFAKREFELNGLLPKKTIDVLKGDKIWIQSEVKSYI